MSFTLALLLAVGSGACKKERPPTPQKMTSLPKIVFKEGGKHLYTFYDAGEQQFKSVTKAEDIPESERNWVRVIALDAKPAQRHDHELVYVADVGTLQQDKSYAYVVVPRKTFERAAIDVQARAQLTGEPPEENQAKAGATSDIVLYGTKWCGACTAARKYFHQRRIPFADKDIETDSAAAAELARKARAAGISPSGVPVIDVRGTLLQGFDPAAIDKLIGRPT